MLSNGSNLYRSFQCSFAQLTISTQCWNCCNTAGQVHDVWLDIRKGLTGVSFECSPSVHPFGVFWPLLWCHSSEKWWSSRQENITKVNKTNKTPTKTSEKNQILFFFFVFLQLLLMSEKNNFIPQKEANKQDVTEHSQLFCLHV